eukprot:gene5527-biopygen512
MGQSVCRKNPANHRIFERKWRSLVLHGARLSERHGQSSPIAHALLQREEHVALRQHGVDDGHQPSTDVCLSAACFEVQLSHVTVVEYGNLAEQLSVRMHAHSAQLARSSSDMPSVCYTRCVLGSPQCVHSVSCLLFDLRSDETTR